MFAEPFYVEVAHQTSALSMLIFRVPLALPVLYCEPPDIRHWQSQWHPTRSFSVDFALASSGP